jgi:hypothetical protein
MFRAVGTEFRSENLDGRLGEGHDTGSANLRMFLYDPQIAGGLLISLPREEADQLITELHAAVISSASHIGEPFRCS